MFYTSRMFYKNGNEFDEMGCTNKEFKTIEKAIKYCHRYTSGTRFAGVEVFDEKYNMVYGITSDMETIDNTEIFNINVKQELLN